MNPNCTTFLAVLSLAPLIPARGQALDRLGPGDRVRVTSPNLGLENVKAVVVAREAGALLIQHRTARMHLGRVVVDTLATRVPVAQISRLQVSDGRISNAGRGAMIGALVGLALGAAAWASESSQGGGWFDYGAAWLPMTAVGGAFWGFVIGGISSRDRWEEVQLGAASRGFSTLPPGRMGVMVTLSP